MTLDRRKPEIFDREQHKPKVILKFLRDVARKGGTNKKNY